MIETLTTYLPRESAVHATDARVKICLLLAYSVSLFFVDTWWGMGTFAVAFVAVFAASKLPAGRLLGVLAPLYVILLFTWAFNAFAVSQGAVGAYGSAGSLDGGMAAVGAWFSGWDPIPVAGDVVFLPAGCAVGCFVVLRILLLTLASFVVAYSTPSRDLVGALTWFLNPLRHVRVPVDDVALTLSLALRFIPLLAEEAQNIRLAQEARGARFDEGGPWRVLKAWGAVVVPLFVNLYRRASRIGTAFDARCYGAASRRTMPEMARLTRHDRIVVTFGLFFCALVVVFL